MHFPLKWTFLLLQLLILMAQAAATDTTVQPYCYKNVTETSYKTVTKTRIKSVRSKNFFKKMVSKKDTQIEVYEDQEPVYKIKVELICCEGYKMNELDLCEPKCVENGCPQHSKCVEPEVCECLKGYFSARSVHDGEHYCQPICEEPCPDHSECVGPNQCACRKGYYNTELKCVPHCLNGCPFGGTCIAPNSCACAPGYKSLKGTCIATCSLGDHCQNGQCVATDICKCNNGFKWNGETFTCDWDETQTSTFNPYVSEAEQLTAAEMEVETDIDNSNDDIDPNQVFDENIRTTDYEVTDEYGSTSEHPLATNTKCPADYIFLKGKCLPLKFASNDIDCWQKHCLDENAVCLENGTCACKEGFMLFSNHLNDTTYGKQYAMKFCLLPAEYEIRMQELNHNPEKTEITESIDWTSIFFIVLGVIALSCALVFLSMKLLLRRTGEIDVEGKSLACSYDNRAEKSVI